MTPAIDVHTHMLNRDWLELLRAHGRPRYELRKSLDAPEGIFLDGAPFMTPQPGHFDYPYRSRQMDEARGDLAIVSLTCPNVYWGGRDVSLKAAQVVTGELRVDTVLQLLVDQVAQLLDADAADCYLFTPDRGALRCAAAS